LLDGERADLRKIIMMSRLYQVGVTVYGYNIEHYASGKYMARLLRKDVNAKLDAKYGKHWKCNYDVEVEVNPTNGTARERKQLCLLLFLIMF
jgi:hypothetical protein